LIVKEENNNSYLYVFQYKDHLGNVRLSYADINNNGTIEPASEILEENNYYPFGLKHQGYNELAGDAHKYKFLNREYQPELGLNTIATDYRHYDAALGRFNNMDALSELAYGQTPYRYGFNNPVYWTDPTGLFESPEAAEFFAMNKLGVEKDQFSIREDGFGGYILTVQGGEFNGQEFYNSTRLHELEELVIEVNGNSNGAGGSSSGEGEGVDWVQVNDAAGAFGLGNGLKTELFDFAVRDSFGMTAKQFKNLSNAAKAAKTTETLGGVGSKYLAGSKLLGKVAYGVTIYNSGVQTVGAWSNSDGKIFTNDNNKWGVTAKAGLDVVMGYVGFLGPVGFGISATYFILDATGAFDSWSQPTN